MFLWYLAYVLLSLAQIVARTTDPKMSAVQALEKKAGITERVAPVVGAPEGARDVLRGFTSLDP